MNAATLSYASDLMAGGLSYQAAALAVRVYEPTLRRFAPRLHLVERAPGEILSARALALRPEAARINPPLQFLPDPPPLSPFEIIKSVVEAVANEHGFTADELMAPKERSGRCRAITNARNAAIYAVLKSRPGISLPRLGVLFGGRHHTTILNSLRRHEALRHGGGR